MITDLDNDILITTQHDTVQEAELIKVVKELQRLHDACRNDHLCCSEYVRFYFALDDVRLHRRKLTAYCHETFNLFTSEFKEGTQYDLRDSEKALEFVHNRLDRVIQEIQHLYTPFTYLRYVKDFVEDERNF